MNFMIFAGYLVSVFTRMGERSACRVLARKHFAEHCSGNREGSSPWVVMFISIIGDIWGAEPLVPTVIVGKWCNPGRDRLTELSFLLKPKKDAYKGDGKKIR
jgi:hypothetical protein